MVALVGAGPGDPGLLTVKAARLIAEAQVLVYDALVSAPIVALANSACELIYVGKRARMHTMPQAEITALLIQRGLAGERVVRLKGGDPLIFGRGGEEAQELQAAGVPFVLVPGISSAIAAPAYAGIPVTHRDYNTSFTIATGHEDPNKTKSTLDWGRLADGHGMSIFLMAMSNLANVVAALVAHGRSPSTPAAVISDGTTPRQRTVTATLETIVHEVAQAGVGAPAIFAVGEGVRVRDDIRWFDVGPLFGKRVLITRPIGEAQVMAAALWEAGAEPILAPTITYAPAPNESALHAAIDRIRARTGGNPAYSWLIFSSKHGVRTFFEALQSAALDTRALGGMRIAAVGPKTAAQLQENGVRADLVPTSFSASELALALRAEHEKVFSAPILAWGALGAITDLETILPEASIDRVAAYETVATLSDTIDQQARSSEIWTFASASAIDGLLAAMPDAVEIATSKMILCIGPQTAAHARNCGLHVDTIAESATAQSLLDALTSRRQEMPHAQTC